MAGWRVLTVVDGGLFIAGALDTYIKRYGTTPDGRLFQIAQSGIIQDSAYGAV